jgi:hypothetical protein
MMSSEEVIGGHALYRAIRKGHALHSRVTDSAGKVILWWDDAQSAKMRRTKPIATGS